MGQVGTLRPNAVAVAHAPCAGCACPCSAACATGTHEPHPPTPRDADGTPQVLLPAEALAQGAPAEPSRGVRGARPARRPSAAVPLRARPLHPATRAHARDPRHHRQPARPTAAASASSHRRSRAACASGARSAASPSPGHRRSSAATVPTLCNYEHGRDEPPAASPGRHPRRDRRTEPSRLNASARWPEPVGVSRVGIRGRSRTGNERPSHGLHSKAVWRVRPSRTLLAFVARTAFFDFQRFYSSAYVYSRFDDSFCIGWHYEHAHSFADYRRLTAHPSQAQLDQALGSLHLGPARDGGAGGRPAGGAIFGLRPRPPRPRRWSRQRS